MSYEEQAELRAAQHREDWKDEPLTWWQKIILEIDDKSGSVDKREVAA